MTTPHEKAAEALRIAGELERGLILGYLHIATLLREYAALLQAQPVACLVENESAIMAWPITCLDEARTYCDEGEEPVLLYARPQPAEAGRVPLTDEQINTIFTEAHNADGSRGFRYIVARAIERHHGILPKEQP